MNENLYIAHKKNFHTKPCVFTDTHSVQLKRFQDSWSKTLKYQAPAIWKPVSVRHSASVSSVKSYLKTYFVFGGLLLL